MARSTKQTEAPETVARQWSPRVSAMQLERLAARAAVTAATKTIAVEAPFTGEVLGRVPQGAPADVAAACAAAREAQQDWARRSFAERAAVMLRFHDLLIDNAAEILDIIQLETGKARRHAFEEVLDVAIQARYYAHTAAGFLRPRRRQGALPRAHQGVGAPSPARRDRHHHAVELPAHAGRGRRRPGAHGRQRRGHQAGRADAVLGALGRGPARRGRAPARASAGRHRARRRARRAAHRRRRLPHVHRLDGHGPQGRGPGRRAHSRTARWSSAARTPCSCCPTPSLRRAVPGAVRGITSNSGQLCVSIERVYVHAAVYDAFAARLAESLRAVRLGASLTFLEDMGSLIGADQLAKVEGHVADAVGKGAEVLAGGRARPDLGPYFFEPTLLAGVTDEMELCRAETFGPVAAVYRCDSVQEMVERANDSSYGLSASIWTRDTRCGRELATRLQTGTVNINEAYAATWASAGPMGGFKESGLGGATGAQGIVKFTEAQTVAVRAPAGHRHAAVPEPPAVRDAHERRHEAAQARRAAHQVTVDRGRRDDDQQQARRSSPAALRVSAGASC